MNLPIYRAKKIRSDEYITGDLHIHKIDQIICNSYIKETNYYILTHRKTNSRPKSLDGMFVSDTMIYNKIDPTTLSIHFPDMIDSQGNKIFASLNEDGKGGDILYYKSKIDLVTKTTVYFENYRLITHSKGENTFRDKQSLSKFAIIGIQE